MRTQVGSWLRNMAGRIDQDGQPRPTGLSFTYENRVGLVMHGEMGHHKITHPGPGVPLYYLPEDYERAYDESADCPKYRFVTDKGGWHLAKRRDAEATR